MTDLTEKQEEVLAYISAQIITNQRPPTLQEIIDHFGWYSPNAAAAHLKALESKGAISRDKGVSRGIKILDEDYK